MQWIIGPACTALGVRAGTELGAFCCNERNCQFRSRQESGMYAISAPEPDDSKQSDRHEAKEAIEPFFNDWAGDAQGKLLKDAGTPVPVFDGQAALDRVNGNRDLLWRMVGVFAIQWRERLANIAGAVSRRNGFELE